MPLASRHCPALQGGPCAVKALNFLNSQAAACGLPDFIILAWPCLHSQPQLLETGILGMTLPLFTVGVLHPTHPSGLAFTLGLRPNPLWTQGACSGEPEGVPVPT
jgi:hypothetical protein